MARRDVLAYYKQVEDQYFEMLADVKDYEKDHVAGYISDEKYEELLRQIDIVKVNYERLSWIVLLLEYPNRKAKKLNFSKQNKQLEGFIRNSSAYKVLDENADALKRIKELMKKED